MFRKVNLYLHCLSMSVNSFRPPPACHHMMSRGIFNCYGSLDHAADILHSFFQYLLRIATNARIMAIFTCMAVSLRKTLESIATPCSVKANGI